MDRWDDCTDPEHSPPLPDKSIHLYVGVDASTKRDRSAVVSVYREDGKVKLGPKRFWQPSVADPLDLEDTMESYLLELYRGYHLLRVNYDPFQFHRSAMTLAKRGLPMQEYPQTVPNLTECGQNLYDLVQGGSIVLYPDKELRKEAVNALGKETTRGVRIVKEKVSQKIDQIVALAMAGSGALKVNSLFEDLS
jgi:phage terminase large subunit-like protein